MSNLNTSGDANAVHPDRLALRKPEAARVLGISERKLHDLLMSRELPSFKIGRAVLIPVEGIEAFISHRVNAIG